ncbi:MAG: nucleotide exchange factor GrpE [Clostridia bacterium]|nr:nucleotide exchange factor GrpE [Clostridia bacterium]
MIEETNVNETNEDTPAAEEKTAKTEKVEKAEKGKKTHADKKLENEIAALKKEIEDKDAALAEEKEKYLRLAAEYDNFRRRSKAEREGVYADACADVIAEMLPVLDNVERAAAFTDGAQVLEGVKMMAKSFAETFKKLGVEEIETKTFDPHFHNAVMHIDDEAYGEGEIVEVFQKGYKKGDKVIRYAMVKSAN